nr:MAG: hypothetical protein [uncultured archaeon]
MKKSNRVKSKNLTPEQKRIVKAEIKQLFEFNKFNLHFFMKIRVIKKSDRK